MPDASWLVELIDKMMLFVKNHPYTGNSSALNEKEIKELYALDARLGKAAKDADLPLPAGERHPDGGFLLHSGLRYFDVFPHRGLHVSPSQRWFEEMNALRGLALEQASTQTGAAGMRGRRDPAKEQGEGAAEKTDFPERWLTVSDAERVSDINKGLISRAADDGALKSNGKKGRGRRIDSADLIRWKLKRLVKPEPAESYSKVESDTKKHVSDYRNPGDR